MLKGTVEKLFSKLRAIILFLEFIMGASHVRFQYLNSDLKLIGGKDDFKFFKLINKIKMGKMNEWDIENFLVKL